MNRKQTILIIVVFTALGCIAGHYVTLQTEANDQARLVACFDYPDMCPSEDTE